MEVSHLLGSIGNRKGLINGKGIIDPRNIDGDTTGSSGGQNGNYNNNNNNHTYDDRVQLNTVNSAIILYIVSIIPTNREFLDRNSQFGRQMNALRYNPAYFENEQEQ